MDIYTTSILISIAIYALVGNYAGRKVKHLEDYFVAGRQAPTLLIVGTLVASVLSTNAFLGETGFSYATQGGAYILWPSIWVTGYVWGALYFGHYLRRSRALTVAEFFGWRFDSRPVQAAAGVTIVLGLGGYLLAVTQGAGILRPSGSGGLRRSAVRGYSAHDARRHSPALAAPVGIFRTVHFRHLCGVRGQPLLPAHLSRDYLVRASQRPGDDESPHVRGGGVVQVLPQHA